MTKKELIEELETTLGDYTTRRDIRIVVDGVFDALTDALEDDDTVTITGFGVFTRQFAPPPSLQTPRLWPSSEPPGTKRNARKEPIP